MMIYLVPIAKSNNNNNKNNSSNQCSHAYYYYYYINVYNAKQCARSLLYIYIYIYIQPNSMYNLCIIYY